MDSLINDANSLVKIAGILYALFHFFIGFVIYRDVVRINRVYSSKNSKLIGLIAFSYVLILLGVIIFIILS